MAPSKRKIPSQQEILDLISILAENENDENAYKIISTIAIIPRINNALVKIKKHFSDKDKNFLKKVLIDNIDILIEMALQEYDPELDMYTNFKISEAGNFFRYYESTPKKLANKYKDNIWFTSFFEFDEQIYEKQQKKWTNLMSLLDVSPNAIFYVVSNEFNGKTSFLKYLAIYWAKKDFTTAYINSLDLKNFFTSNGFANKNDIANKMKDVDVLLIDDLFMLANNVKNEWFLAIFLEIINYRSEANKKTFIAIDRIHFERFSKSQKIDFENIANQIFKRIHYKGQKIDLNYYLESNEFLKTKFSS
ncbi:hypothetical protein ACW95P_04530 [Candidatus Mycoplasma pogonae]